MPLTRRPGPVSRKVPLSASRLLLIFALPVLGFFAMYLLVHLLPVETNPIGQGFFMFALIMIGLGVPYWMLKISIHEAKRHHSDEQELELKNVPKDKQQWERKADQQIF